MTIREAIRMRLLIAMKAIDARDILLGIGLLIAWRGAYAISPSWGNVAGGVVLMGIAIVGIPPAKGPQE